MTTREERAPEPSFAVPEADGGVREAGADEKRQRQRRADVALCNKLRERLESARDVDMRGVEVVVSSGIVTLVGTVPEQAMRSRILQHCTTVQGVAEIHDQLLVAPHTREAR